MRRHSPYNYAFDNPVRFIDPDGMASKEWSALWLLRASTGASEEEQDEALWENGDDNQKKPKRKKDVKSEMDKQIKNVSVRDGTKVSDLPNIKIGSNDTNTIGLGLGDILEIGQAFKPNNITPQIGKALTVHDVFFNVTEGNYGQAFINLIESQFALESVVVKGAIQLSQTEAMQTEVGRTLLREYNLNVMRYKQTGNELYQKRADHNLRLLWQVRENLEQRK